MRENTSVVQPFSYLKRGRPPFAPNLARFWLTGGANVTTERFEIRSPAPPPIKKSSFLCTSLFIDRTLVKKYGNFSKTVSPKNVKLSFLIPVHVLKVHAVYKVLNTAFFVTVYILLLRQIRRIFFYDFPAVKLRANTRFGHSFWGLEKVGASAKHYTTFPLLLKTCTSTVPIAIDTEKRVNTMLRLNVSVELYHTAVNF